MSATDPDLPAQALRFSLGPGAPAGARVNPSRGTFSWTPSRAQAASTNIITAAVTDDGAPPLSDSRTFQVIVGDYVEISLGRAVVRAGDGSSMPITLGSSTPVTNANFAVDFSGQLSDWSVQAAGGTVVQAALQPGPGNRVFVAIAASIPLPLGAQPLAQLNFTLGSNQPSAFLALTPSQASAYRMDGSAVSRILFGPGRVVAVGDAPLLEAVMGSNQDHSVILYSPPDGTYAVERSSGLGLTANWVVKWQHTPGAGLSQTFLGGPCTNGTCFYRAR